jgi:sugar lactone lactonase YvrE
MSTQGQFQMTEVAPVEGVFDGVRFSAWPVEDVLGEGPLWHRARGELFWFDVSRSLLRRMTPSSRAVETLLLPDIGSAAAVIDRRSILIAMRSGCHALDLDRESWSLIATPAASEADVRPNDGRCDPFGRFWIGTMADPVRSDAGVLYCLDGAGLTSLRAPITVPNAIAFSPDRRAAYFADSPTRTILALELDPASGGVVGERVFARVEPPGVPDGAVVDADGCLWNAEWDGGRVVRYRPDGAIDRILRLPVSRPTCPSFGGPDLRTLYVTSARYGLEPEALAREPLAGAVFAIEVGAQGQQEHAFRLPPDAHRRSAHRQSKNPPSSSLR